jgi:hypothetical protein
MSEGQGSRYSDVIARSAWVVCAAVWALGGVRTAGADTGVAAAGRAVTAPGDTAAKGVDPCRYVAASEVEPYTGTLVAPPFRAADDAIPRRNGDNCVYRGTDGREVLIDYLQGGAKMAGTVGRRVPAVMDRALANGAGGKSGGSETAGPSHAVMGGVGPGPWDNSNWFPSGQLIVYKGDDGFSIDLAAANGGKDGAIDLATKAIARMSKPLVYDGANAVATAPKAVTRVPACQLLTKEAVAAIIGPLTSAPVQDPDGNTCTYKVASSDGEVPYAIAITWTNGYKQMNTLKRGPAMVGGLMAPASGAFDVGAGPAVQAPANGAMPAMPALDPAQQKMFGQFTKGVGVPGMNGAVSRQMKTDSAVAGPWDAAAMVNGQWFVATKHEVAITIILSNADYDKAKALVGAACQRL